MRYHLFQKFFGEGVEIKQTSFLISKCLFSITHHCTRGTNWNTSNSAPSHKPTCQVQAEVWKPPCHHWIRCLHYPATWNLWRWTCPGLQHRIRYLLGHTDWGLHQLCPVIIEWWKLQPTSTARGRRGCQWQGQLLIICEGSSKVQTRCAMTSKLTLKVDAF